MNNELERLQNRIVELEALVALQKDMYFDGDNYQVQIYSLEVELEIHKDANLYLTKSNIEKDIKIFELKKFIESLNLDPITASFHNTGIDLPLSPYDFGKIRALE